MGLPVVSVAAVVMVAVYCVLPVRGEVGVNVAVSPLTSMLPITAAPPAVGRSVKFVALSVELAIVREKVAETEVFSPTSVALFAGAVAVTDGAVLDEADITTTVCPVSSLGCSPPQPDRLNIASNAA